MKELLELIEFLKLQGERIQGKTGREWAALIWGRRMQDAPIAIQVSNLKRHFQVNPVPGLPAMLRSTQSTKRFVA